MSGRQVLDAGLAGFWSACLEASPCVSDRGSMRSSDSARRRRGNRHSGADRMHRRPMRSIQPTGKASSAGTTQPTHGGMRGRLIRATTSITGKYMAGRYSMFPRVKCGRRGIGECAPQSDAPFLPPISARSGSDGSAVNNSLNAVSGIPRAIRLGFPSVDTTPTTRPLHLDPVRGHRSCSRDPEWVNPVTRRSG